MAMQLQNKHVLVVGMSRSGYAAALLAASRGGRVSVTEAAATAEIERQARRLRRRGIAVEWGAHTEAFCRGAQLVITSPGVKAPSLPLRWARRQRIPIVSEIEFAGWFCRTPVIAITGSNGKTTVTTLTAAMLRKSGKRVVTCGNIGTPWSAVVADCARADVVVLEVSSFQLQYVRRFHPRVSVLLNISQNHLDYHHSMRAYMQAKANVLRNMTGRDWVVFNADDRRVKALAGRCAARPAAFKCRSSRFLPPDAAWTTSETILLRNAGKEARPLISRSQVQVPGQHNVENIMAAALAARALGATEAGLYAAVREFRGVEHRCEAVAAINGVNFVNDSKSTTTNATERALAMFAPSSVILLCGGRNKGSDFRLIRPAVQRAVARIVVFGEAAEEIAQAVSGQVPVAFARSLENAVEQALEAASPGQCVLLSPMCASFDMFRDYEDRGRKFKQCVQSLRLRSAADPGYIVSI